MKLLRRICRSGDRFLREEDGPTSVEYAVMLALILGACVGTINTLAASLAENMDNSANAIISASN